MRTFRYREDRAPVLVILSLFALDLLVYAFVDHVLVLALWTLVGIIPKGCVCAWNHHHQHVPTFFPAALNRALELVYALHTGLSGHAWVLHHSLGHHVNYLDQTKDESRWRREDGTTMGPIEYTLDVTLTSYWRAFQVGRRYPRAQRVFLAMAALTLAVVVGLTALRPLPALFVFVLPMTISLLITSWATYGHHTGNDTSSHFVGSNNVIQRVYNLVTGNLGYHTAHHYKPGVHWSRLPVLHAEIAPQIPASCYGSPGFPWILFGPGAVPCDALAPVVDVNAARPAPARAAAWQDASTHRPQQRATPLPIPVKRGTIQR